MACDSPQKKPSPAARGVLRAHLQRGHHGGGVGRRRHDAGRDLAAAQREERWSTDGWCLGTALASGKAVGLGGVGTCVCVCLFFGVGTFFFLGLVEMEIRRTMTIIPLDHVSLSEKFFRLQLGYSPVGTAWKSQLNASFTSVGK